MRLSTKDNETYMRRAVVFRNDVFDKIARKKNGEIFERKALENVKAVCVINSAPRSGSSLLFSILKKIPNTYSLNGESVPLFKLNLPSLEYFSSDAIADEMIDEIVHNSNISRDFLSHLSVAVDPNEVLVDRNLWDEYLDDLTLRFSIQWPQIQFSYSVFRDLAEQAFISYKKNCKTFEVKEFYLLLFKFLRKKYPAINPYYYDMDPDMIKKHFPHLGFPTGPANDVVLIEEPPLILISPNRKLSSTDFKEKTLLLKTTIDCYRMNFIKKMFPNAKLKIIYLVRNPAASINGLYDGWLHRGFFSHNLKNFLVRYKGNSQGLMIKGYSDKYEWGKWWWNFDLPPGWENYIDKSLPEVCAFQWYAANNAISSYIAENKGEHCLVRYEDLVANLKIRTKEMQRIINFMGTNVNTLEELDIGNLPVVQATYPPKPYRWMDKRDMIMSVIVKDEISAMANKLGYNKDNIEKWA